MGWLPRLHSSMPAASAVNPSYRPFLTTVMKSAKLAACRCCCSPTASIVDGNLCLQREAPVAILKAQHPHMESKLELLPRANISVAMVKSAKPGM